METGKVNMSIKIGGQTVNLTVPFHRQDFIRDTENEIDKIFRDFRRKYPQKDERELLAMIVYRYASFYRDQLAADAEALSIARRCEEGLDRLEC